MDHHQRIAAAHAAAGLYPEYTNEDIFKIALQAERTAFANASGADSAASMHGGILRFDAGSDFKRLQCPADLNLLVVNSKMQRSTNQIVARVGEFRAKNTTKFENLVANAMQGWRFGKNWQISNILCIIPKLTEKLLNLMKSYSTAQSTALVP